MSQTLTSYIPVAVFLAITAFLVWAGLNRAGRTRAEAEARADARMEAQSKDLNRTSEAIERIAAALEARNQSEAAKSNPAAADSKTGH
jgi:hypothetical protein